MLSSSRSYLALCETKGVDRSFGSTSMSKKVLFQSYSDSALRRDGSCEGGFIESEAEIEGISAVLPMSFTALPPLEQRRQRRIRDLVELLESFANGIHETVKKIQIVVKEVFSNILPTELAVKSFKISKIESSLQYISDSFNARKVWYKEIAPSEDLVNFYIDNFGSSLFTKLEAFVSMCDCLGCHDIVNSSKDDLNNADSFKEIFREAFFQVKEYLLRLQLVIRYVLYCTPRQHIDHRPLTNLLNELNRVNRRNFDKSFDHACEKDMSDSLPVETSSGSIVDKKKKAKIKRRYSLDSSALRKLSSISRSFSFGRKSNRCLKQENGSKSVDKFHNKHNEKTDNHDIGPCHSSPYNRIEKIKMGKHKNCTVNQDKETSFDFYNLDRTCKNEDCLDRPCALQDSSKYTVEGRINNVGNENPHLVSKIFTVGNPTVDSRSSSICSEKSNEFGSHLTEIRDDGQRNLNTKYLQDNHRCPGCDKEFFASAKDVSKSLTVNSRDLGSFSADKHHACTCGCAQTSDCSGNAKGQSGCIGEQFNSSTCDMNCKASAQSITVGSFSCNRKGNEQVYSSSMPSSVSQEYDQSLVRKTSRESGRYSPVNHVRSVQGGSPTILKRELSQHHSPTLINDLDTSFSLYPLYANPISDHEVKPKTEVRGKEKKVSQRIKEAKSKAKEAEREDFVIDKDKYSIRPNLSSDFYTADEGLIHGRHLGIMDPEKQGRYLLAEEKSSEVSKSLSSALKGRYQKKNSIRGDANVNGELVASNDRQVPSKKAEDGPENSMMRLARGKASGSQNIESSTPKATDIQNPKKIYDIPIIEDSSKGIKVTVTRARKKLRDFTSPKVFRKKKQNIHAFSKETDSQPRKENVEDACPVNNFFYDDLDSDKSLGYHDNKQESFSSVDLSFNQSLISNILESPQNESDGAYHGVRCKYGKLEACTDEGDLGLTPTARRSRSSRSSSVSSDLSISSDFHSTVTKMLRSNSLNSNSPIRVGSSTFYCEAERDDPIIPVGSGNESDDFSPNRSPDIVERKDSICFRGSNPIELLNADSSIKDETCKESVMPGRRENGCSPKQEPNPIRISRSEPVFDNSPWTARLVTDTSYNHHNLQNIRKIPRTRILSWSQNFDFLLSDKDGVKVFSEFLRSEYSEENIKFWLACENFKSLKGNKFRKSAQKIYQLFIEVCSASEVNLDHQTRRRIKESLSSPSKNMFDTAQTKIKELMEQDSYQRFIKSLMYEDLLKL